MEYVDKNGDLLPGFQMRKGDKDRMMNRKSRRDKAKAYKDPARPNGKVEDTQPYSWLGRWEDNGWSIKISRRLTDEEWRIVGDHADETWNDEEARYDPGKSLAMLERLFPDVQTELVWPKCGHRTPFTVEGKRKITVCEAPGINFTGVYVAVGALVGIVRCDTHKGAL